MEISLPARVVALKRETVTIELNGTRLTVQRGGIAHLSPGDWVLVTNDTVTNVISPDEAAARQKSWGDLVEILTNSL